MATTYTFIASNRRRSTLLVIVFVLVLIAFGWILSKYFDNDPTWIVFATVFSLGSSAVSYWAGDAIVLRSAGAVPVTKEQSPYLTRMVENLAITSGLPMPKVYVIPDPTINALATGRDPQHASIAVTTGAIERLENEELEGVLAHELSHIGNYDIRFMTLVAVLVGTTVLLADWFWRARAFGGGSRNRNAGILNLLGVALILFAPLIAKLIQLAVSRRREFLADASGTLLTRYPQGLANALKKIQATNTQPLTTASNATAHIFLSNPFGVGAKGMSKLFATHPPIEDRIKALETVSA